MAFEICASVASEVVKGLVHETISQANYSLRFNKHVEDLKKERKKLNSNKETVLVCVRKAKDDAKQINNLVEKWLANAETLMLEAIILETKALISKTCCLGHCPSWIWRFRLGKRIEKKKREIADHNKNCTFNEFSRPCTPPGMKYYSSEGFIYFNSTKLAYDQILDALKDDEVSMIGLYGMGGCGKTTLAKEVGKEAEQLFDKVIFVAVSSSVDVRSIQGKIADSISLGLKGEDELGRAKHLWSRLTSGERILLILDDVWEKLDFEAIGIPLYGNHKGCIVLVSTRLPRVCNLMGCQRMILLSLLTEEEAWTLFQKQAEIIDQTNDTLKSLAMEITRECKGLPVAVKAVASTLKGKTHVDDWDVALCSLRNSIPMDIEKGLENPYRCLQLSYDNLENVEAKQLFLFCSVFPKDYEIHEEHLNIYGIGLGLFGEVNSYKRARNQVRVAKNKLVDSCLLLDTEKEQCVKMHDLVRDVALWIAKKENKVIVGPERSQTMMEEQATNKNHTLRYLWCDQVDRFANHLDCSELRFLYINDLKIHLPAEFFNGMKELRVLVLCTETNFRRKSFHLLPNSVRSLSNLHGLHLHGWQLGNISFLGSLRRLETLALKDCSFHELPNEIIQLTNLRVLDLSECRFGKNPSTMITRCSQLEELYYTGNGRCVDGDNAEFFGKNSSSPALQRYRIELGMDFWYFERRELSISRGLCIRHFDPFTSNSTIKDLVQRAEVLGLREICGGCKNIVPDMVQTIGGINELTELWLCDSKEIECLIDTSYYSSNVGTVFSKLVNLRITDMNHLQVLCRGPPPQCLFQKLQEIEITKCSQMPSTSFVEMLSLCHVLKILKLKRCPMLTYLFTPSTVKSLVLLEELEIEDCDGLKKVIRDDESDEITSSDQESDKSLVFSKLKRVVVRYGVQLECLLPVCFARDLVQLETLEISGAEKLKYIFNKSNQEADDESQIINLAALKTLRLTFLPNIIGICPENNYPLWPSLQKCVLSSCEKLNVMSINNCIGVSTARQQHHTTTEMGPLIHSGQMTHEVLASKVVQNMKEVLVSDCEIECIFNLPELISVDQEQTPLISCLERLSLYSLIELRHICKGPTESISLQSLRYLSITSCCELKCIFPTCVMGNLSGLEVLDLNNCQKVEKIFGEEDPQNFLNRNMDSDEEDDFPHNSSISSPPLDYSLHASQVRGKPKLCSLRVLRLYGCPGFTSLFTPEVAGSLVQLKELEITACDGLKHLLTNEPKEGTISDDNNQMSYRLLFPNKLEKLDITSCKELEYLFPVSCAHRLLRLESLAVRNASKMKYIFGQPNLEAQLSNQNDQYSFQIIQLPLLKKLTLVGLSSIIRICSEVCALPSLHELVLEECPQFNIVSINNWIAGSEIKQEDLNLTVSKEPRPLVIKTVQNIKSIIVDNCKAKGIFQLAGVSVTRESDSLTSSLEHLVLKNLPELTHICMGPTQFMNLQYLEELKVIGCIELKCIFSECILESLPQLKMLTIGYCNQLQQIIEESHPVCQRSGSFYLSSLQRIIVNSCPMLTSLFTQPTAKSLTKLEEMIVEDCNRLEYMITTDQTVKENKIEDDCQAIVMLPNLKRVRLERLPKLIHVCQGFKLQHVHHEVDGCPNLASTTVPTIEEYQNQDQDPVLFPVEEEDKEPEMKEEEEQQQKEQRIKKTTNGSVQDPALEKSTVANSSPVHVVENAVESGPVTMDQQALEENKGTIITRFVNNYVHNAMELTNDNLSEASASTKLQHIATNSELSQIYSPSSTSQSFPSTADASVSLPSLPKSQSSSSNITAILPTTGKSAPSPLRPQPVAEDLVDFHNLFKIDARRASLLDEAFAKYPHLWEWHKSLRPKYCKWGYKSLADMLMFLKLEAPNTMDDSKREEFKKLCAELESFHFDKKWMTSIHQRVMDVQVDNVKLKRQAELQSQESSLVDELSNLRAELAKISIELSINDTVFDL